jgi:hypothetical protein
MQRGELERKDNSKENSICIAEKGSLEGLD